MSRVSLIFACDNTVDILTILSDKFKKHDFAVNEITIPSVWRYDRRYINKLRNIIRLESKTSYTIVFPPAELFLSEPDLLLSFSAYAGWFNPQKISVIPHLWTPIGIPTQVEQLRWVGKPPMRVGFMGRTFRSSSVCRFTSSTPRFIKKWLLSGAVSRNPTFAALLNEMGGFAAKGHSVFARLEALDVLAHDPTFKEADRFELVSRDQFTGSSFELDEYKRHLTRNTYILCPRGTENYSYRMYEALAYGRIPVIIDTNIVLPNAIEWQDVALIVPYDRLDRLGEYIANDYFSTSTAHFIERQNRAFRTVQGVCSLQWVDVLVKRVIQQTAQ